MGNRSASEILAAVNSKVAERRDRQTTKRKARGTLADRTALFEAAWLRGQREKDSKRPPARIVGKDRALIKSQIIKPAEGTDLDTEQFAAWVGQHWQAIGAQYFTKSKHYPEVPVIPWLIKCFEIYVTAYQQREFLDETGTKSTTDYMARAAKVDEMQHASNKALSDADREIALLKAELKESKALLAEAEKTGTVRNDGWYTEEQERIINKGKRMVFPDFDDEPQPKRKRKIRKSKR